MRQEEGGKKETVSIKWNSCFSQKLGYLSSSDSQKLGLWNGEVAWSTLGSIRDSDLGLLL